MFNSFLLVFRGKKQYEPPRFMAISVAIEQLLEVELKRGENGKLNVIVALHVGFFLLSGALSTSNLQSATFLNTSF